MEFDVQSLGPCRKKVAVTIPAERVQAEFEKKYGELNDAVALPGFRPGHAPRKLLERRFSSRLGDEVKHDLVKEALEQMIEQKKVEPLGPPEVDVEAIALEPDAPLTFDFEMLTRPEFETPGYEGVEVKVPSVEVSGEEIDEALDDLRRHSARLEDAPQDATVDDGDVLVVDWEAREGDSVEAHGDNVYYRYGRGFLADFHAPELDDQLEDCSVGTTVKATIAVAPDDPRVELRGRELELAVTLKKIRRYALPEIDQAFLKKLDYDDEEELRDEMGKQVRRAKERARDRYAEDKAVERLVEGVEMSVPDEFVERELENWTARKRLHLEMEETEEDEIARQIAADREDAKSAIERDLRRFFLLDRIADAEAIEVADAEVAQAIQEIARAYGRPIDEVMSSFRQPERLQELRTQIRHRKTAQRIRDKAALVEDPALFEDDGEDGGNKAGEKKATKTPENAAGKKTKKAARKASAEEE